MVDEKPSSSCESEYLIAYYNGLHDAWLERFYKGPTERISIYLLALTFVATWSGGLDDTLRILLYILMWIVGILFYIDLRLERKNEDRMLNGLRDMQAHMQNLKPYGGLIVPYRKMRYVKYMSVLLEMYCPVLLVLPTILLLHSLSLKCDNVVWALVWYTGLSSVIAAVLLVVIVEGSLYITDHFLTKQKVRSLISMLWKRGQKTSTKKKEK